MSVNKTFTGRMQCAAKLLKSLDLDLLVVDNLVDVQYLTGMKMSAGRLLIGKKGSWLVVDARYYESAKANSPCPVVLGSPDTLGKELPKGTLRVGFDSSFATFDGATALRKTVKPAKLVPVNAPFQEMRMVKDAGECKIMQSAAELGSRGYEHVVSLLKTGITELELARALEIFWLQNGGEGLAFDPIIAFGANSALPHYRAGKAKLKKGMTVLIDIGVKVDSYCSDMTRTVFFGKPSLQMQEVYEVVRAAQQEGLNHCKPGVHVVDLDRAARKIITVAGYGDKFTHSLGHSVGIDIHEYPRVRDHKSLAKVVLEPGMHITIEPGVYLPGIGGVRIEDTVLITDTGCKIITKPSKSLRVI